MLGKVKKWLGIEGVKLEIIAPEEVLRKDGLIEGKLRFQSLNSQVVTEIDLVLIEKYSRGRGQDKLIDEYQLGAVTMPDLFEVPAGEILEINFSLPFSTVRSDMDEFGKRNFLFGGVASAAKYLYGVRSEYRIEAEARVKGVALNPFDRKKIAIK